MSENSTKFLMGYDLELIYLLKTTLLKTGLTKDFFFIENGQTYLNLQGTRLTCRVKKESSGENYYLYNNDQLIAQSNHTKDYCGTSIVKLKIEGSLTNLPDVLIDDDAKQTLRNAFLDSHNKLLAKAKGVILIGFFRRTKLNTDSSLKEIIEHGMASNNRTRQICVQMGWLTKEGNLAETAPPAIKAEFTKTIPMFY